MQLVIGTLMFAISLNAEEFMNNVRSSTRLGIRVLTSPQPSEHIYALSAAFTTLVTLSATQGTIPAPSPILYSAHILGYA